MINLKPILKLSDKAIKKIANDAKGLIKSEIPVDSGNLRSAVTIAKTGDNKYKVGHDTSKTRVGISYGPYNYGAVRVRDYGSIVYFGHGIIRPRDPDGFLVFTNKQGETIFTKQVKAVKPNKFIDRAFTRLNATIPK